MRAIAVVAAFLAAAAPAAAASSAPPVRPARASDAATRPFPASYTEWWRLHAVDPSSGRWLIVRVQTFPTPTLEAVVFDGKTSHGSYHPMLARGRTLLDVADLRRVRGGWHLSLSYPTSKAELTLTGRPGITVGPWRLGRQPVNQTPAPDFENASFRWSALVPAGRLDGWVDLDLFRLNVRGWRGYLDHTWGKLELEQPTYDHWDFAASHPRPGESWVLQGLEPRPGGSRRNPITGNDRLWTGVLLHATPQGTTWCRPRVRRTGWFMAANGFDGPFPDRVTAACGRRKITFRRWHADYRWGAVDMTQFVRGSGPLPDRTGFIEHIVPPTARG
jgi:hypothetical protein